MDGHRLRSIPTIVLGYEQTLFFLFTRVWMLQGGRFVTYAMRCCSAIACVTFKKTKATISNLNVLPYFGMVLHNSNISPFRRCIWCWEDGTDSQPTVFSAVTRSHWTNLSGFFFRLLVRFSLYLILFWEWLRTPYK